MGKKENMNKKIFIRKGDSVMVIAGENKGATGEVTKVDREKQRVYIRDVNLISKHMKPNSENPNGGIIKTEGSIHISNIMLVDPKSGKPTRIGFRKDDSGKTVRVAKKSGEVI